MDSFVRVCPAVDVKRSAAVAHQVAGQAVAIVRTDDDQLHAISDTCSHEDFSLATGVVVGCTIECAWHGSEFDVRTGAALNLPATEPVAVYPIEVRDGDIYVSLNPSNRE